MQLHLELHLEYRLS